MFYPLAQVFYDHATYFMDSYEVYCLPIERETEGRRQKQAFQTNSILQLPLRVSLQISE